MMSKKAKRKILMAAVLCACTTLYATPVWAATGGSVTNGAYYGGRNTSSNGVVEGKEVVIEAGDSFKGVYGGYAFKENADWGSYFPVLNGSSNANNNKVIINGGIVTGEQVMGDRYDPFYGSIAGAWANYTSDNTVIIEGGNIETHIYGGYSMVSENEDEVGGANSENYVDKINNNRVEIKGSSSVIEGINIAGAYVDSDGEYHNRNLIRDNSVVIDNVTIKKNGSNTGNIYGAYSSDINNKLSYNSVIINSGIIETNDKSSAYGQGIFGACADGKAIIYDENDGEDKDKDYNGDGIKNDYIGSSVEYNSVTINGGKITGAIYGAYAWAASDKDTLINNKVVITGGEIIGDVYAIESRNKEGFIKNNGIEISGNTANLSQANLHGVRTTGSKNIEGQYLLADNYQGSIKSIDNFDIVNILNNSNVTVDSIDLYSYNYNENENVTNGNLLVNNSKLNVGGLGYVNELSIQNGSIEASDIYTTDAINIINSSADLNLLGDGVGDIFVKDSDIQVTRLYKFDSIRIDNNNKNIVELGNIDGSSYFDSNTYTQRGEASLDTDSKFKAESIIGLKELNVDMSYINWEKDTAVVDVSGSADLTGTAIRASGTLAAAAGTEVQNGDRMSFIKAGELKGVSAANVDVDKLQIGFATEAKVEMQDGGNSIDFVITGAQQANEQAGIIGESRTAAIAFVNQGSDILNNAFGLMDDGKYGIKTFAAAHGNYSKYETGSHIRVNGWSMIAGVGNSDKLEDGTFSWGVFFENGSGNYRTYNDYNGYNLRGFGSAVYNGGGALARYRSNAGNYAEIGLRAGMLKNSLGNAVADGYGVQGGYDEETSYYGAHLGVGHIFAVDENSNVDVYGKYFYNHHESEDLNILGDEVRFDSADSNRLRLGLRYNQNDGNAFSHYYGLAWDYEFSGDANVTAAGFDTGNPSLKGSTAVIEAGIHYAPDNSPWSIDLGLQGYGGQRDGFSGTMQLNYSFN